MPDDVLRSTTGSKSGAERRSAPHPCRPSGRLDGKLALITGGSSGIGAATAEAYAAEGADCAITYRSDPEGAEKTAKAIRDAGCRALVLKCDLGDETQILRCFEQVMQDLGTPDILVNNAGMDPAPAEVADMKADDWRRVLSVNLDGPFLMTQAFIRARRAAGGGGRIVTVSSVHEDVARAGTAAYDASKGGLRMLTRTLALELAKDGITANNIAPGMILTDINAEAQEDPQLRREMESHIPLKRAGEAWEIARLAVYLASDDADYVTGQTFTIDGGLSLNLGQGA